MAYGLSNSHVNDNVTWPPKVLQGSTVGCPSDSLASCFNNVRRAWHHDAEGIATTKPNIILLSGEILMLSHHNDNTNDTCN